MSPYGSGRFWWVMRLAGGYCGPSLDGTPVPDLAHALKWEREDEVLDRVRRYRLHGTPQRVYQMGKKHPQYIEVTRGAHA